MEKQVLVIGCTQAGLQAAKDLADVGLYVNLVESSPFIGGDQLLPMPDHLKDIYAAGSLETSPDQSLDKYGCPGDHEG